MRLWHESVIGRILALPYRPVPGGRENHGGDSMARSALAFRLVLPSLCVLVSTSASCGQVNWPQFMGPDRNGITSETGWLAEWPNEGPPILWNASLGKGYSSFAVVGDRVWTMGNQEGKETILCLNALTGEELWRYQYPAGLCATYHAGGPCTTPSIDGDAVYTLGKEGHLCCLSAMDGKLRWERNLPKDLEVEVSDFGISCSPLVEGDLVLVDVGVMAALDKKDGKVLWKHPPVRRAFTSPVAFDLEGRRCAATLNGYGLLVFDLKTGEEGCRYRWETFDDTNCATPVVQGNRIFISSAYDVGGAVLEVAWGKEPNVIWKNRNMRNHFALSVLWKGYLYGFDGSVHKEDQGELRCVSFETGEVKWSEPSVAKGGLIMSDGKIIAITDKGELVVAVATPQEFKTLSRFQVLGGSCWTPPVLSGGLIFCRNAEGDAVCVDVRVK